MAQFLDLPANAVRLLKGLGVRSRQDFMGQSSIDLASDLGVGADVVEQWKKKVAIEVLTGCGMLLPNSSQLLRRSEDVTSGPSVYNLPDSLTTPGSGGDSSAWSHRSTGCKALDSLLYTSVNGSGLPAGRVIELLGFSSSGRTQVVLSTACTCAHDGIPVLIIDTCNGISISSINAGVAKTLQNVSQATHRTAAGSAAVPRDKYERALSLISVERCFTLYELLDVVSTVARRCGMTEDVGGVKYGIIFIDCFYSLILPTHITGNSHGSRSNSASVTSSSNRSSPSFLVNAILLQLRAITAHGTTVLFTNARVSSSRGGRAFGRRTSGAGFRNSFGGTGPVGGGRCGIPRDSPPDCFLDSLVDIVIEISNTSAQLQEAGMSAAESRVFRATVIERPLPFKLKEKAKDAIASHVCLLANGDGGVGRRGGASLLPHLAQGVFNAASVSFALSDMFCAGRGGESEEA